MNIDILKVKNSFYTDYFSDLFNIKENTNMENKDFKLIGQILQRVTIAYAKFKNDCSITVNEPSDNNVFKINLTFSSPLSCAKYSDSVFIDHFDTGKVLDDLDAVISKAESIFLTK